MQRVWQRIEDELGEVGKGQHALEHLAAVMTRLPQVLVNVPDVDKARADEDPVSVLDLVTYLGPYVVASPFLARWCHPPGRR